MRARLLLPCLLVALAAPCLATDPPAAKPVVILPVAPKPDIPKPDTPVIPVLPDNVVKLVDDQVYDIVIKGPVAWRWHPPGVVSVTVKEVPAGRDFEKEANFWDGKKTKVYPGPCTVHFLKAATPGGEPQTTDLDIIPIGLTDEKQIVSLSITVNAQNPIPPPKPKPDDPPAPEPAKSFRVIFVKESGKNRSTTPGQQSVMEGVKVEEYLNKNATGGKAGWKRRDPDQPAEPGVMGELWTEAKKLLKPTDPPCVVVEKNGKFEIIKVEETPEAMIAVFDKYLKGGK